MRHWTIDPADARNVRADTDDWIAKFRLASDAAAAVRAYNSACGDRAAIAAELAGGLNAPDAAETKGYRDGLAAAEAYLLAQAAQIEDAPTPASPDQASQAISYLTAAAALGAWVADMQRTTACVIRGPISADLRAAIAAAAAGPRTNGGRR